MIIDQDTTLTLLERLPWLRLTPPVIAIGLAVVFKEVNFALLLATFCGCLLLSDFEITNSIDELCNVVVGQLTDADHGSVILFTVLLGAMISLMNQSGGTTAVVDRMAKFADTRQKGQVLTWLTGLIVFFDDYANTLLIGSSMRPLCDNLKISRAKLAFLIDTTAAPVAGLALSTWTAFEIGEVKKSLQTAQIEAEAAEVFFATIPFRIYPLLAIVTVATIAICGRDFGPMLKAERLALKNGSGLPTERTRSTGTSVWFAILPVAILVAIVIVGFLQDVDAYRLLLYAALGASTVAVILPCASRQMTMTECSASWVAGIGSMIPAIIVLILAWSIADVCGLEKLNTSGYIISQVGDSISPAFLPTVAFLTAGAIAVSIGSSFTTMSLLLPLFIPLAWSLLGSATSPASADDPIFLATVGAILAGAIFGDHCSPISDTTVLSSAAAGCDHLQHVATQLPYALLIAVCSILLGYLPIGFGVPWWLCLPISSMACIGVVLFLGQRPTKNPTSNHD
jgi:Na+/H+ antiporter NhaC